MRPKRIYSGSQLGKDENWKKTNPKMRKNLKRTNPKLRKKVGKGSPKLKKQRELEELRVRKKRPVPAKEIAEAIEAAKNGKEIVVEESFQREEAVAEKSSKKFGKNKKNAASDSIKSKVNSETKSETKSKKKKESSKKDNSEKSGGIGQSVKKFAGKIGHFIGHILENIKLVKDVNVRTKTIIPVVILVVCMLVVGVMSVKNLDSVMDESRTVTEKYSKNIAHLGDISTTFQKQHRIIYSYCLSQDSLRGRPLLKKEYEELSTEMEQIFSEYEKTLNKGTETEKFMILKENYENYLQYYDEALALSDEGLAKNDDGVAMKAEELANITLTDIGENIGVQIAEMKDTNNKAMDDAVKNQEKTYSMARTISVTLLVIAIFVAAFAVYVIYFEIVKPLMSMNKQLNRIVKSINANKGDLSVRITIDGKDEIGQLGQGINTFIKTLQKIMKKITVSSYRMDEIVNAVVTKVSNANNNSCDISAIMQELSAAMEEVASTTAGINEKSMMVDENVAELAVASEDLSEYADSMQKRAEKLELTAVENKQSASSVISDIVTTLERAIEDSKSVKKVNELTDEILNIASQTNLLALNASIEASRAGAAGRGFAVVAEEIGKLASSSREAANNIQNINAMVIGSVSDLVASAESIAKYVNENILPDYDGFVDAGKQYNDDSMYINEIVAGFSTKAAELKVLMSEIAESINGISLAVDESTRGIASVAENTNDLVQEVEEITLEMESNKSVAGQLSQEAERFVNL